ncbi:MAG: hypothetical protein BJ554DRAFT_6763, partial [Olpidium bornovanus]
MLYKTVDKKIRPVAAALPPGAAERIENARKEPRLRDPASISHTFTPATLACLRVGGDGLLTAQEEDAFREILSRHGRAFAFCDAEIGCVDPAVVAPMVVFTSEHISWKLKPVG